MTAQNYFAIPDSGWDRSIIQDTHFSTPFVLYEDEIWFSGTVDGNQSVDSSHATSAIAEIGTSGTSDLLIVKMDGSYNPVNYKEVLLELETAVGLLRSAHPSNPVAVWGWGPLHKTVSVGGFTNLNPKSMIRLWHDTGDWGDAEQYGIPASYDPQLGQKYDAVQELGHYYIEGLHYIGVDYLLPDVVPSSAGTNNVNSTYDSCREWTQLLFMLYLHLDYKYASPLPVIAITDVECDDSSVLGSGEILHHGRQASQYREDNVIYGVLFPKDGATGRWSWLDHYNFYLT